MAYDPFDFEVSIPIDDFESPFVSERSTFSDFFHGLWSGIGETADIFGRGVDSDTLRGVGEYIKGTEYAKPDISEYLGVQSESDTIATGTAQGLPLSGVFMAGGAAGAAGGALVGSAPGAVAGGIAGTSAVGAAFARGLYDKILEETINNNPDMPYEDADSYAKKYVAIETLTEMADAGVSLVAGKAAGKLTGTAIKTGLKNGILSMDDIIGASAKRLGAKEFTAAILGDAALSGGSEVAASYLQKKLDEEYSIESENPDYFNTFLIGALISAPFGATSALVESKNQDKIRKNIETGLSSDKIEQRKYTAKQIYDNLYKASPEAAGMWSDYVELNIDKGPISLEAPVLKSVTAEANIKRLTDQGVLNQITKKPEEILKEADIPVAPVKAPQGPYTDLRAYGTSPTGAPVQSSPVGPETPQWYNDMPLSQKELNAEMDRLVAETPTTVPATKVKEVPVKAKEVSVEPVRPEAQKTAQWKKPIYDNPQKISEAMAELPEDSNTLTVEQQKAAEAKKQEEAKAARLAELSAKEKLTLKERKELKDLKGAEAPTAPTVVKTKAGKVKEAAVQSAPAETIITPAKAKKIEETKQKIVDLKESIMSPEVSEQEVAKTEQQIEKLQDKLIETDDTIVPKGEVISVDRSGNQTRVLYPRKSWKKVEGAGLYTSGNGILVKRGDRNWEFIQKDDEGKRVSHGSFKNQKDALTALEEGKTPDEFYPPKAESKSIQALTEPQKALISTIDVDEVVGKALAKSDLRDDPEASGVALEAIAKAATNFKEGTGATFKTWAITQAKGAIKDYSKKRAEINRMERQELSTEVDEGSEKEGTIATATKKDVQDVVPVETKVKEEKAPVAPAKSLKEVLDKHNVPAPDRTKYFLSVADGKKTIEQIDKELSEPTDQIDRHIVDKAHSNNLDPDQTEANLVERGVENKTVVEAARFLKENAPNRAYRFIAEKVEKALSNMTSLGIIFDKVNVAHIGDSIPSSLLSARGLSITSLNTRKVTIWLNGKDVTGKIGVSFETSLHELIHAATQAAILLGNLKVNANTATGKAVADLFTVSNEIIRHFNKRVAESKSGGKALTSFEQRVYSGAINALSNQNEIVAWSLSNQEMQDYLEGIKIDRSATLWSKFVSAVREFLGLPVESNTALSEVLRVSEEIMGAPINSLMSAAGLQTSTQTTSMQVANTDQADVDTRLDGISIMVEGVLPNGRIGKYKTTAKQALADIDEEIRLYEEILRCVST